MELNAVYSSIYHRNDTNKISRGVRRRRKQKFSENTQEARASTGLCDWRASRSRHGSRRDRETRLEQTSCGKREERQGRPPVNWRALLYWLVNGEPRRSGSQRSPCGRGSTDTQMPFTRIYSRFANYVRISTRRIQEWTRCIIARPQVPIQERTNE